VTAPNPQTNAGEASPPYYSLVLPNATKESLTSAATFRYNG
jgi:hypothetical protein